MSPDQITYVLIALIVTGTAILLLLAGAFLARRGRGEPRPAARPAAVETPSPAGCPATRRPAPAVAPAPASAPAPVAAATAPPRPLRAGAAVPAARRAGPAEEAAAVTPADLAAAARRVHDPREEEIIEGFLSISPAAANGRVRGGPRADPRRHAHVVPPAAVAAADSRRPLHRRRYRASTRGPPGTASWPRRTPATSATGAPSASSWPSWTGWAGSSGQFGQEAARRVLAAVGGALRRNARRTDRVAHVGGGRFLVLLPETDEIQAINYVERVRAECERWLEAGAVATPPLDRLGEPDRRRRASTPPSAPPRSG